MIHKSMEGKIKKNRQKERIEKDGRIGERKEEIKKDLRHYSSCVTTQCF